MLSGNSSGGNGIGIDIGTSKVVAVRFDGARMQVVQTAERANDAVLGGLPADRHEQDPQRILQLAAEACREVVKGVDPGRITGLAITGQMHGVVLVDPAWHPLTPLITWRDRRTAAPFLKSFPGIDGTRYAQRTGCQLNPGYGGATLAWLARQDGIPHDCTALTIADWLAAQLCQIGATDRTHAASWGLYDLSAECWDAGLVNKLHIPAGILPEIRQAEEALGLSGPRAAAFGLPEGLPVWLPIGDNQASVYAASQGREGCLVLNLGTGGQISMPASRIACDGGLETRPAAGTGLLRVGASLCGGWSYAYLAEFLQRVCQEIGGVQVPISQVYDRMTERALTVQETDLWVDVRFTGHRGQGSRDSGSYGSIQGINAGNLVPAELTYAFQTGMVRELASLAESLEGVREIVATGNAIRKTPGLVAVVEKVFGKPCLVSPFREEAACGAVLWMLNHQQQRLA